MAVEKLYGKMGLGISCLLMVIVLTVVAASPAWALPMEMERLVESGINSSRDRELVSDAAEIALDDGVPPNVLVQVTRASLDGGVSPAGLASFMNNMAESARRDLPAGPMANKILEGLAKGVDEKRIVRALGSVGGRLKAAGAIVGNLDISGNERDELITSTADAMAAGMSRRSLERVFGAMARRTSGTELAPEKVLGMVKTASGYGVDQDRLVSYTEALVRNRNADEDDIRRMLDELASTAREGDDDDLDELLEKEEEELEGDEDGEVEEDEGEEGEEEGEEEEEEEGGEDEPEGEISGGGDDSSEGGEEPESE